MIIRVIIGISIGGGIGALMGYYGQCSSGTCPLTANPIRGAIYGGVMGALFAVSFSHSTVRTKEEGKGLDANIVNADKDKKVESQDADL